MASDDPPRYANHGRIGRYVAGNHRIGAHARPFTDGNGAEHLGTGTADNVITQRRVPLALVPACSPQRYAVIKGHVVANLGGFTNHDTHAVIDKKTSPDGCARMYLNTGQPARKIGDHPCRPFEILAPEPVGQTMEPDRMQPGVGRQHFKRIARRRVPMKYRAYVFTYPIKHLTCPFSPA